MSDSPLKRQWLPGEGEETTSKNYALSGKIMLASIIILFVVVVFLVLLHLYARWYLLRRHRGNETRRRNRHNRSSRIVFFVDTNRVSDSSSPTGGIDASVLKSLPLFVYSSETHGNLPECAVCLSEFENGETGRVLPKCKHSFHTECIDMWFHSNSTCPLCRSPVELFETEVRQMTILVDQPEYVPEPGSSTVLNSPVQHDELMGTTSLAGRRKGIDVRIDVPSMNELVVENEFRLPSPSQGFRSPGSRLQSLKRILTMSRKPPAVSPSSEVGPSCVTVDTESDLESAKQESANESTQRGTANLT